MASLAELRALLRQSRAALLAAVHGLPEDLLQRPQAIGPWSVAQVIAQRIEAESRTLTLVQSMLHGHPLYPDLPQEALDRGAVERRRGWTWNGLMSELYQQREETGINLDDLAGEALTRTLAVGGRRLSPFDVLATLAAQEEALALRLAVWREQVGEEKRS